MLSKGEPEDISYLKAKAVIIIEGQVEVKDDINGSTTTDPWALYIYALKALATFIDLRESGRGGNNLSSISLIIQSS
jgi:hypothetical protein